MKLLFSLSSIIALLTCFQLYGQTFIEKEYVNKHLIPSKQEEAAYYRIASVDRNKSLAGKAEYFYLNNGVYARSLYARGEYEKNERVGKWEWWYANGQLKEVGYYSVVNYGDNYYSDINYKIESFWDSTGNQLVKDGTGNICYFSNTALVSKGKYENGIRHGEWIDYFENGALRSKEIYEHGKFIEGISYKVSGESFVYTIQEVQPEPEGGMQGFMGYLMRAMKYPKEARKKGIQGKVFVQFVVDKDGSVTDVAILKGIGGGCDEEAMRVMRECPKWNPGMQRGQPVKVRMSIPLIFKLG
jgi:TonB family protein